MSKLNLVEEPDNPQTDTDDAELTGDSLLHYEIFLTHSPAPAQAAELERPPDHASTPIPTEHSTPLSQTPPEQNPGSAQATPDTNAITVDAPYSAISKGLRFKKTTAQQHAQQTVEHSRTQNQATPADNTDASRRDNMSHDILSFTQVPEHGFPYVQLGTDPTFILSDKRKAPKLWCLVYQKTKQKPRIIALTHAENVKIKSRDKLLPLYHYLIYEITKEACDKLIAERAVSSLQMQAFFVPYNPANPNYICTIRGFHFDILKDESSPDSDVDVNTTVRNIVQDELRSDQAFARIICARCITRHPIDTFIGAIEVISHTANLPKPRGSHPNDPHPTETRWNLYFNGSPPLQREGYYALTDFFTQK
ncbi:hypothetical protein H0H92_005803, partial [Tricholoma furcatifolium]